MARSLGISETRVHNWVHRGAPERWIPRISRVTGGRVPCHRFDPVAFPEVLGTAQLEQVA